MENTEKSHVRADNVKAAAGTIRALARLGVGAGDRFLDLGANVCAVSNWACAQGCDAVVAYEPFPLALERATPAPGVQLFPCAVTSDGRNITMAISKEAAERDYLCSAHAVVKPNSSHTVFADIPSMAIAHVVESHNPTIIKLDIEGGEYEVLAALDDFSGVRGMFIEWHGCNSPAQAVLMPLLAHKLRRNGLVPSFGWPRNASWDARSAGRTMLGVGFWRETLFVRGEPEPACEASLDVMVDGARRLVAEKTWAGSGRFLAPSLVEKLVAEELA